jgi:hypothetical protein
MLFFLFWGIFFGGCSIGSDTNNSTLDSSFFRESNAVIFLRDSCGETYLNLKNIDSAVYMEAASLSKPLFAKNIWDLKATIGIQKQIEIGRYLSHSAGIENPNFNSCKFKYSDTSYLLANSQLKKEIGFNFEQSNSKYSFRYSPKNQYVAGYIRGDSLFRKITPFDTALPNGTLYLNSVDARKYLKDIGTWSLELYKKSPKIKICNFKQLYWLDGMGIDYSIGRPIILHWGCNWCYNHLILIDVERKTSTLILTNSIIGAHEIAEYFTKTLNHRLEFFDYIGWW